MLDTTTPSVNSALQRARSAIEARVPPRTQQAELDALGEDGRRELVRRFVAAWESADLEALLALLTADARFTMPPLPAWFAGRADVGRFLAERVFATPWRLVPLELNAQVGFACYQQAEPDAPFRLGAVDVLTLRGGAVAEITGFLDPGVHGRLGIGPVLAPRDR
jgi:RNA polymerase sigma-70 factor (ECF subfamily)